MRANSKWGRSGLQDAGWQLHFLKIGDGCGHISTIHDDAKLVTDLHGRACVSVTFKSMV